MEKKEKGREIVLWIPLPTPNWLTVFSFMNELLQRSSGQVGQDIAKSKTMPTSAVMELAWSSAHISPCLYSAKGCLGAFREVMEGHSYTASPPNPGVLPSMPHWLTLTVCIKFWKLDVGSYFREALNWMSRSTLRLSQACLLVWAQSHSKVAVSCNLQDLVPRAWASGQGVLLGCALRLSMEQYEHAFRTRTKAILGKF